MSQEGRTGRRLLLGLGVLALAACSSSGATTELNEGDNGATVAVEVGDQILVALHDPTTADLASPGGRPMPSVSSDRVQLLHAGVSTDGESSRPTAMVYRFEARRTGSATISIPIEHGPFTVLIIVR